MYWDLYLCMGLGFAAVIFSFLITISQLHTTIKYKDTSGIAVPTYIIFMVSCLICLSWTISFYYKTLISNPTTSSSMILAGKQAYGPYWLWQCTILPIMWYYTFDFLMGLVLTIIKLRHLYLVKKLNINERALASYLLNKQKDKQVKSNYKLHTNQYFGFAIIIILLISGVTCFITMWGIYVHPTYDPSIDVTKGKWTYVWVINLIGAASFEAISWPQFIKCIREKNTSGISLNWAIFLPVSILISFFYSLALTLIQGGVKFPPDTIGALIFNGIIVNFGILFIKLFNIHRSHKLNMTEMEYTQKYLIPAYEKKKAERERRQKVRR